MKKLFASLLVAALLMIVYLARLGPNEEKAIEATLDSGSSVGLHQEVQASSSVREAYEETPVLDSRVGHEDPKASPESGIVQPLAPLGRTGIEVQLSQIAESFMSEDPDVFGMLDVVSSLSEVVDLVPGSLAINEKTGGFSGQLEFGAGLRGTFSAREGGSFSVEIVSDDSQSGCRRQVLINFKDEEGSARNASLALGTFPTKMPSGDSLGGTSLRGWRASIDPLEGAELFETETKIRDVGDGYTFETQDSESSEARQMREIANTSAVEMWRQRLIKIRDS